MLIADDEKHFTAIAESLGATVFRNAANLGRGAARARALRELTAEFIVFCDAGVALAGDFCERALAHFKDANVAAVFGQIIRQQERRSSELR